MAGIQGKSVGSIYKDLLNISGSTPNEGVTSSLKSVFDGDGTETAIQLSTTHLKIPSGKTLEIAGTFNSVNATLTGDLTVGDDLTVTDLISGASGEFTGRVSANDMRIGGGSGDSGTTIDASGNVLTDSRVTCNDMHIGGGFVTSGSGSGLSISQDGRIDTNEIIVCEAIKTTQGVLSSSASNSPKVKLDNATKVTLTVDDSGTDKEILKVEDDGEATIKDKAGDTKFVVKDTGVLKYKAKTTAELTAIKNAGNAAAGDIAYDSVKGFVVYVP